MIGIDSNVLVRLVTQDDERQTGIAQAFIRENDRPGTIFINVGVLLETLWVLRRRYKFKPVELISVVDDLMHAREFEIDRRDIVAAALERAVASGGSIPDCLIVLMNEANGCSATMTFDEPAADAIPGMDLLT